MTFAGPLAIDDPGLVSELRAVLEDVGYTGVSVRKALGVKGDLLVGRGEIPVQRRRLAEQGRLGSLIGLFVLDLPLRAPEAARALAPLRLDQLETLGVLESAGEVVRATVRLVPHDDLLIACDRAAAGEELASDHVAGINNTSVTLAHVTVRRPVTRAVDIGTGNGFQAILASTRSDEVVATDVNPRALNFAAFNALLNHALNLELRDGSYFEPIAGEQFGLVVSNPPFVISPDSAYLFRDSGLEGDKVSEQMLRAAPAALDEGGFATLLLSWTHPRGVSWSAPLRAWLEGSGCDALLLHHRTQDPLTHAAGALRDRYANDPAGLDAALSRWLVYLKRLGIEGVAYGAVVLRRRDSASNWIIEHEFPPGPVQPAGEHILRLFEARDFLARCGEGDLLVERFALAEHARVAQNVVLRENRWQSDSITLSLDGGLAFEAAIDPVTALFLAGLDGEKTLAQVAAELAEAEGQDADELTHSALPVIQGMLELGFLERR